MQGNEAAAEGELKGEKGRGEIVSGPGSGIRGGVKCLFC